MLTNFFTVGPDFNFDRSNFHILDGFGQTKIVVRSRKLRRIVSSCIVPKNIGSVFVLRMLSSLFANIAKTSSVRVWIGVYNTLVLVHLYLF